MHNLNPVFFNRYIVTVRDFLSWVKFINVCTLKDPTAQRTVLEPSQAYIYGAFLVFLDALGLTTTANSETTNSARELCSQFLSNQLKSVLGMVDSGCVGENEASESMETEDTNNEIFSFGGFCIPKGELKERCSMLFQVQLHEVSHSISVRKVYIF